MASYHYNATLILNDGVPISRCFSNYLSARQWCLERAAETYQNDPVERQVHKAFVGALGVRPTEIPLDAE